MRNAFREIVVGLLVCCGLAFGGGAGDKDVAAGGSGERVVVLTFDDAVLSHATFVGPLLKKYGFGATFFICEFPGGFADKTKYMTWEQIRSLHDMGFEIANHTRTHSHVNKIRKDQLIEELEYIEGRCAEFGIAKPTTFAYPGYDTHPMALGALPEKGYRFARTGGSRPYRPDVDDPLLIPSFSTTGTDKQRVMGALEQAKDGEIVVLTIHGVPDTAHPHVNTPPELFAEYVEFMHENNYTVIAMRDLGRYVKSDVSAAVGIDRHALVSRHNVTVTKADALSPLSVGNGQFAFTADITGLQTFGEYYGAGMPLGTQSQWGWHSMPNPQGYVLSDVLESYEVRGRGVPYASDGNYAKGYSPAATWLRANPHRVDLGRVRLRLTKRDGSAAEIGDLSETTQTLDLWAGLLSSRFEFQGEAVLVETVCHGERDILAVRIESALLGQGRLSVGLEFPYGSTGWRESADWESGDKHETRCVIDGGGAEFTRILDADRYYAKLVSSTEDQIKVVSQHRYEISQPGGDSLEAVIAFSPKRISEAVPDFDGVKFAAGEHWRGFWNTGGAIDFSGCTDRRASELERRVVLSQYLTAVNCAGAQPPQETGLVHNSWHGKFHLEMHWWHAAHFGLWGRLELLERSLPWYQSILPAARATAAGQGYRGARWPKMASPDGRDSPSTVGVFLIWQQPHPIYYAELCYRGHGDRGTLDRYREIVFETAEFMASYAAWDEAGGRYVLGPALIPAQESYGSSRRRNVNPTFELAYWWWALETAQKWRERLGMSRNRQWDDVMTKLSKPNVRDGVYTGIETEPFTIYRDHPSMVAAYGVVGRTPLVDPEIMRRTYDDVLAKWDWASTWGWDYPMLAMTAARLGEAGKAVDALFIESQKNRYLANGHNYQSSRLPLYLPGNGGLLSAVAMMAAGWDGCPDRAAPGFPDDGQWDIRFEGLRPMP